MNPEPIAANRWTNRALFGLLWPLLAEQMLTVTMGVADTIMVGSVGEHAVSGVNIVDQINNLTAIAFTAMSTGGAVVVSQYIGRRDNVNSRLAARQLVYCVIIISLALMVITLLLHRPIISLVYGNIEHDVMDSAAVYFFFAGLSYPFLALQNANAALFRAAGNSKVPMLIALLMNVFKIGINAWFIFVLQFGVMGAALSTLLCRMAAAAITTMMLNRAGPISLSGLLRINLNPSMIKNILNISIPSGLESSMFMIGKLLTQRIFTSFGTSAIAANAIASVINSFSFMPGTAFGLALLTVVGQCIGAGDYAAAKKQTLKIMKIAYITLILIGIFIYIFLEPMVGLFNLSPEARTLAKSFLRVHCISIALGWTMAFVLPNALRAAGDVFYIMIVAAVSMWAVRVITAYLFTFALGVGPMGVWLAMGADFVIRSVFYCSRWLGGRWQEKRVITN